jgi:hypothetical protein
MKTTRELWIEAGIAIAKDPRILVRCPEKDDAILEVWDTEVEWNPGIRIERHMRCPNCGAYEVVLIAPEKCN